MPDPFYASFDDIDDMFGESYGGERDFDPFPNESDTDRTGLDTDLDNLEDRSVFEPDSEDAEEWENLDTADVEVGESIDEESINEVDLDVDPDNIEPDWNPEDDISPFDEATDISHEDETVDTQHDDEPYDQWSEVSPNEEILQWDDIIEDDDISQLEETGFDEPLYYDTEEDMLDDPTDEAFEDIEYVDHRDDLTDNITDEIEDPGRDMLDSGNWVESLEDFLDFTEQDVSSFHEVSTGFEMEDGYDPPYFPDEGVDLLELGNLVDDVFAEIFPDPVNEPFWWFDSFD